MKGLEKLSSIELRGRLSRLTRAGRPRRDDNRDLIDAIRDELKRKDRGLEGKDSSDLDKAEERLTCVDVSLAADVSQQEGGDPSPDTTDGS